MRKRVYPNVSSSAFEQVETATLPILVLSAETCDVMDLPRNASSAAAEHTETQPAVQDQPA